MGPPALRVLSQRCDGPARPGLAPLLRGRGGRPSALRRFPVRKVACGASPFFPHHRMHVTHGGAPIPAAPGGARRTAAPAPEPEPGGRGIVGGAAGPNAAAAARRLGAALLDPEAWAGGADALLGEARARLAALCAALAAAYERAWAAWRLVLACWPAWRASLRDDAEYVLELSLGVLPAWLVATRAAVAGLAARLRGSVAAQRAVAAVAASAREVAAELRQLRRVAAEAGQLVAGRLASAPGMLQLPRLATAGADGERGAALTRGLTHSMAVLGIADVAARPAEGGRRRFWQRRRRADRGAKGLDPNTWEGRLQLVGALPGRMGSSLQNGLQNAGRALPALPDVQGMLRSGSASASSGVRHILVQPLQRAGFISSSGRTPTVAGVIAAASLLMAASVCRGMQRQAAAAEERAMQQLQLQMKAESLAAQRARFRRALDDSQAASAAGSAPSVSIGGAGGVAAVARRRSASPPDADAWEQATMLPAGAAPALGAAAAAPAAAAGGGQAAPPELDPEAAREFQRFMAGARATDVQMWDTHMVEDLPKLSVSELQRQTAKIRAAATEEERAAMEDAESRRQLVEQHLNSQLAELSGAPIGRAAREAWRKEQQQRKAAQEAEAAEPKRGRGGEPAAGGGAKGAADSSGNPFAISHEARAQWEADDHLYTDAKKPAGKAGWGFGLGSGGGAQRPAAVALPKQQQQQSEGPQRQRRGLPAEVGAAQGPTLAGASPSSSASSSSSPASSVFGSVLPPNSCRSAASQPLQAGEPAASAAGGGSTPVEGTPEWEAMRVEMLASGAARRARRAQMMQQQGGAEAPALPQAPAPAEARSSPPTGWQRPAPAAPLRSSEVLENALQRPRWPGGEVHGAPTAPPSVAVMAAVGSAAASTAAPGEGGQSQVADSGAAGSEGDSSRQAATGQQPEEQAQGTGTSGRLAAAAAAADASSVTASPLVPRPANVQRAQEAAAASAEAEAEALAAQQQQQQQEGRSDNPFAVDKAVAIDDDRAFELGHEVEQEAKRIQLRF